MDPSKDSTSFFKLVESPLSTHEILASLRQHHLELFYADKPHVEIPVSREVMHISKLVWNEFETDARIVARCVRKTAQYLLAKGLKDYFSGISDFEHQCAFKYPSPTIATSRFDCVVDSRGAEVLKFVEFNATIPAMQGYSDIVSTAFQINPASGMLSNTEALLKSLLATSRVNPKKILILSRPNDTQTFELQWYQKRWTELGIPTKFVHQDAIKSIEPNTLIYRHLFGHLIKSKSSLEKLLLNNSPQIFNAIAAHLEVKSLFACLSFATEDSAPARNFVNEVGFARDDLTVLAKRIPWTRIVHVDSAKYPFGRIWTDRLPTTNVVLKKNRSFGGRSTLFTGAHTHPDFSQELWIAQERLQLPRLKLRPVKQDADLPLASGIAEFYWDFGIFLQNQNSGGVVRFSPNPAVNLGLGGGFIPLSFY